MVPFFSEIVYDWDALGRDGTLWDIFWGEIMSSNIKLERVCRYCEALFIARTTTTNYCSHKCANAAYKSRKRQEKINVVKLEMANEQLNKPIKNLKDREFLSPSETALLLNIGRSTLYRYLMASEIKSVQMKGKTIIRRMDIDIMFETAPAYRARPIKDHIPIVEFYTVEDIKEKYKIKETWIFKIVKENKIPKTLNKGKSYFSKKHIDNYFKKKRPDDDFDEWYSVEDLKSSFGLTTSAVYSYVSEHNIPKKKDGRTVYYSKKHIDISKKLQEPEEQEYYSTDEAAQKYGLTKDSLYNYIRHHNIPRVKAGRFIKISKKELDQLFEQPIIL